MRADLFWTPQARQDLIDIYVTIGLDNEDAAERLYSAIENQILLLVDHPRLGVRRSEIAQPARMLVEGQYLILYETHPDTNDGHIDQVEIVRIIHGRRDLSRVLWG